MARNYRRKCDEVDYGCDSGGEDYEYESEGEDIMDDDGDDLDEEDEDLADEEDEEEDGQEFFIPIRESSGASLAKTTKKRISTPSEEKIQVT